MKTCSKCKTLNPLTAKFCEACGIVLNFEDESDPKAKDAFHCDACGALNAKRARFCEKCGKPTIAAAGSPVPPPGIGSELALNSRFFLCYYQQLAEIQDSYGKAIEATKSLEWFASKLKASQELSGQILNFARSFKFFPPAGSEKKSCGHCGTRNPSKAKFCEGCGENLGGGADKICRKCSTPNLITAKFCEKCGTEIPARVEDGEGAPRKVLAPETPLLPVQVESGIAFMNSQLVELQQLQAQGKEARKQYRDRMRDVNAEYEKQLTAMQADYEKQMKVVKDRHDRRMLELNGDIAQISQRIHFLQTQKNKIVLAVCGALLLFLAIFVYFLVYSLKSFLFR